MHIHAASRGICLWLTVVALLQITSVPRTLNLPLDQITETTAYCISQSTGTCGERQAQALRRQALQAAANPFAGMATGDAAAAGPTECLLTCSLTVMMMMTSSFVHLLRRSSTSKQRMTAGETRPLTLTYACSHNHVSIAATIMSQSHSLI